ncbi:MAG TPA: hydroxymethylglutaryl-CoA synthase [Candidatus Deferrimicrobium sp.]|nr:hydroxymethylglutaryl-CoA synthase [Candidatus Deferrimicrobium sp.]
MTKIEVCGYGCYIPRFRIKREEIQNVWGHFEGKIKEKAVMGYDEDTTTMAVEAAKNAIANAKVKREDISVIAVGSSSPPYALRSMAAELAMAIGISQNSRFLDFKESEKAGTTALLTCSDIIANQGGLGLVVGSDAPISIASDSIENAYGASAAALIVGKSKGLAELEGSATASIEFIADRFRKDGSLLVEDLGIPQYYQMAYTKSIQQAVTQLLGNLGLKATDFQHVFIQGHDTQEPTRVLRKIGVDKTKLNTNTINLIGDTAAASVLTGLVGLLEIANPGERILCVSYGSGAGSDAFSVLVKEKQEILENVPIMNTYLENKNFIDYNQYLKFKELINLES